MQTCYKSQEHLDELVVAHASCDYFQDFLLRNMDYLLLVAKHVSQLGKTGVGISLNSIVFYSSSLGQTRFIRTRYKHILN
jgi:hypothetical protein